MTTHTTIYRVAGQVGQDLVTRIEDTDLTGMSVSLTVRYEDGGELTKAATVFDAVNGQFHIVWEATDLVEGVHCAEWTITNAGPPQVVTRFPLQPIKLIVRAQV
ncbi:MAG: hypothetical protein ACYTEX_27505 [Planctomycetota bacterium]|jgi:hypothetical protein